MRAPPRTPSGARALLVTLALLAADPASAQDALRGKRLYLDAARIVGSGVSCVDCHGGLPKGGHGIDGAADDPVGLARAIDSIPQMAPFRGRFASPDLVDLAAYIGNPFVPSPRAQVTTRWTNGDPGPDNYIDFGEIEIDHESAVAMMQITNTGSIAFTITASPELVGDRPTEFAVGPADCEAGTVVSPQRSCEFALRFRPTGSVGIRIAGFRVPHDWVYGANGIGLLGTATPSSPVSPSDPPAEEPSPPDATREHAACSTGSVPTAFPLLVLLAYRRRWWACYRARRRT